MSLDWLHACLQVVIGTGITQEGKVQLKTRGGMLGIFQGCVLWLQTHAMVIILLPDEYTPNDCPTNPVWGRQLYMSHASSPPSSPTCELLQMESCWSNEDEDTYLSKSPDGFKSYVAKGNVGKPDILIPQTLCRKKGSSTV